MLQLHYYNENQYVNSKELHTVLQLNQTNYSRDLKAWLSAEYLFQGKSEFSLPVRNYDYINSSYTTNAHYQPHITEVVGLRLEFAKLITLDSKSPLKKQFVQWLLSLEAKVESFQLMSRELILGLLEISKLCTYIDNQLAYYAEHKRLYFQNKEEEDGWDEFDKFRNSVLGLMTLGEVRAQYEERYLRKPSKELTKIELNSILNSLQSLRASMFDFLAQQSSTYSNANALRARDLSSFVVQLYRAVGIDSVDIKPRGFSESGQLNMFYKSEDIDFMLISKTVKQIVA
jgi:phage anti-repressor protein